MDSQIEEWGIWKNIWKKKWKDNNNNMEEERKQMKIQSIQRD